MTKEKEVLIIENVEQLEKYQNDMLTAYDFTEYETVIFKFDLIAPFHNIYCNEVTSNYINCFNLIANKINVKIIDCVKIKSDFINSDFIKSDYIYTTDITSKYLKSFQIQSTYIKTNNLMCREIKTYILALPKTYINIYGVKEENEIDNILYLYDDEFKDIHYNNFSSYLENSR